MSEINFIDFVWIILLVLLNGFFVASEFAFVKIRSTQVEALVKEGSRRAKRAEYIIKDLDRSMSSTQLGITLASIALGFVGEEFFHAIFENLFENIEELTGVAIFVNDSILSFIAFISGYLVITFLHVVLGELAPKSLSIQFATRVALICAEPLYWFMKSTSWLLSFFVATSNFILGLFGVEPVTEEHHSVYTEDELKVIIKDSIRKGEIEPYESRLIFNILDFTDSNVKSILTPRIDLEALPAETTVNEILIMSIKTGFSRIPIYKDHLDNIIGFVHVKDVIGYANGLLPNQPEFQMNEVLRPVLTVPEGKSLDDLMKNMQSHNTQVAVVIDEYGTVEGIVTLEDIIEYIFGPIDDEFDSEAINLTMNIEENRIIAGGQISIETFNNNAEDKLGMEIESNESATLAGYVLELFDSEIPQIGDQTTDGKLIYTITQQNGNRIEEIEIKKVIFIYKVIPKNEIYPIPSPIIQL